MTIGQAIQQLKLIEADLGSDAEVCFLDHDGEFFEYIFPCGALGVGMPNEAETEETPVCAFMTCATGEFLENDCEPVRPKLKVVKND
jgi:hypothetical protein